MKDTLEMARFAEVYKYWTTAAWCSIVIPLSMKRQTCAQTNLCYHIHKTLFWSSSARYPGLRCCFYLLNAILLRGSNLLELGRKDNLWDQGTSRRIAGNYRLMVFHSRFRSFCLSFSLFYPPFHFIQLHNQHLFDLRAMAMFRVIIKAVNCWVVLDYFLNVLNLEDRAWTFSNENLTLKCNVQVYRQIRNTISLNK